MISKVEIEAPAKVNLTLDVISKRPDGYHELETVMHQIDLVDKISISPFDSDTRKIKLRSSSGLIPHDHENLAWKAAELFLNRYVPAAGVEIFIEKNIPVGAGLAGGSTDAAAVILGLNKLYNCGIKKMDLLDMAAAVGSDVPFCLWGGSVLARGRGEVLKPLPGNRRFLMLVVKPEFQLSTAEVYRALNLNTINRRPDTFAFLEAWKNYDIINISKNIGNVLETVSIGKHPEIFFIKEMLKEGGALNALMSGSGPSVFGIFNEKELALNAFENIKKRYREVFLVSSYERRGDLY